MKSKQFQTIINTPNPSLKLTMFVLFLAMGWHGFSQEKNELSFHLKGQFSKLTYQVTGEKTNLENGWGVGINYSYYLWDQWSIGTGAEFQTFSGSFSADSFSGNTMATDSEGDNFEFRYTLNNYNEEQSAYYLNVPLKLQYESPGNIKFYGSLGFKIGFLMDAKYETNSTLLETSGYYSQYDVELKDPQFMGFGEFGNYKTGKKELDLTTNYVANLEAGVKVQYSEVSALYLGLFLDYGLNDITKETNSQSLVGYDSESPTEFRSNSLLNAHNNFNLAYVDEVKTIAFGLKVRYGFSF